MVIDAIASEAENYLTISKWGTRNVSSPLSYVIWGNFRERVAGGSKINKGISVYIIGQALLNRREAKAMCFAARDETRYDITALVEDFMAYDLRDLDPTGMVDTAIKIVEIDKPKKEQV